MLGKIAGPKDPDRTIDSSPGWQYSVLMPSDHGKVAWGLVLGEEYAQHVAPTPDGVAHWLSIVVADSQYDIYLYIEQDVIRCDCLCLQLPVEDKFVTETHRKIPQFVMRGISFETDHKAKTISITARLPVNNHETSRLIFSKCMNALKRLHHELKARIPAESQRLTYIYPGRFQPPHNGHFDVIRRLVCRNTSIFPHDMDKVLVRYPVHSLIIAAADRGNDDKQNPLPVGIQRLMLQKAVDADVQIAQSKVKVFTETLHWNDDPSLKLAALLKSIPLEGTYCFVSGNPSTVTALRDIDLRCVEIKNRENGDSNRSTFIRKKIIENSPEALAQVRQMMPGVVYEFMEQKKLFERIQKLATGG